MEPLPVLSALSPRDIDAIAAAAHAVQANVAALKTAWCKRANQHPEAHDIATPSPGPVRKARHILIPWQTLRGYTDTEALLRLRQVWGEFCALCWIFPHVDPQCPISFDPLPPAQSLRCLNDVYRKLEEVQTRLWRLRHEQQYRLDPNALRDPDFCATHSRATSINVTVFGKHVSLCSDSELFAATCEHAGMLAALRWITDDRWDWEAPGIMDLTLHISHP